MYYFQNHNTDSEPRKAWRNSSEIRAAAVEHERRRFQMIQEMSGTKPDGSLKGKQSGWVAALFSLIK